MIIEPHADVTNMSATLMQMYIAFTRQGFSEAQAMQLVIAFFTAGIQNPNNKKDDK